MGKPNASVFCAADLKGAAAIIAGSLGREADALDYLKSLDFIFSFADLERGANPVLFREFNLDRVRALLELAGDPHLALPMVHVAGTKGKGSTVSMMGAVLEASGMRAGVYTSPHLHSVRERIAITGTGPITEAEFAQKVDQIQPMVLDLNRQNKHGHLTTFEMLTVIAFMHFQNAGARFGAIEVGLGGRLDATNVVSPQVCGISNISLDHMDLLGDTLSLIAAEKAGIIKEGVPVVSAPQAPEALQVIERIGWEHKAPLTVGGRDITWAFGQMDLKGQHFTITTPHATYPLWTSLLGDHQVENAATVVGMCERLMDQGFPITPDTIQAGMAAVTWPARLEVVSTDPLVVIDGAHNAYSIKRLMETIRSRFTFDRLILVMGLTRTKDLDGMLRELGDLPWRVITTKAEHPRAMDEAALGSAVRSRGLQQESARDTASGIAHARAIAGPRDLILIAGSLFVAAEAREAMLGIRREPHPWTAPSGI